MEKIREHTADLFSLENIASSSTGVVAAMVVNGVNSPEALAAVAVGGVSLVLGYKEKRQERMYKEFLDELKLRQEDLEQRILLLEEAQQEEFINKYFGYISDYVLEEVQKDKIKYLVNGFVNLASIEKPNEDFVLTYYDTLQQLRLVDLAVLKMYRNNQLNSNEDITYADIMNEFDIEYEQYDATREKLLRLGIFTTKRDENENDLYRNMDHVIEYVQALSKGKPTKIKTMKKLTRVDRYKVSKFGGEFFHFFLEK